MYKDYLNKLVECLHSIRMYGFEGIVSDDYEQGMQKLIDLFSRAKIEGKRVFFYRQWRQCSHCQPHDG